MDPIEQLRALRDDGRWLETDLELSGRLVRRAPWRDLWPRIALGALVGAATTALVVAALVGVNRAPSHAPVSAASPSPSSTTSSITACDSGELMATTTLKPGGTAALFARVTLTNTSRSLCSVATAPVVHLAEISPAHDLSLVGRPAGYEMPARQDVLLKPAATAYLTVTIGSYEGSDWVGECRPELFNAIALALPHRTGGEWTLVAKITKSSEDAAHRYGCSSLSQSLLGASPVSLTPGAPFTAGVR